MIPKRDEFTLGYRLIKESGGWKVYDVVIEGVSLVSNYRGQFHRIITESGYDELLRKMEHRSEDLKLQ